MPAFSKTGVPFLLQGSGTIAVDASRINLRAPLAPDAPLLSVDFTADGAQPLVLGQPGTVKLGLAATARAVVVPMFPGSAGAPLKLLEANGLGGYFAAGAHADRVVLAFDVGASADANVTGTFTYAPLTAATTVDTGGDGGFSYFASFDAARPAGEILPEFFKSMRLPEQLDRAPHPGEAVCLRYGGYLRLGAEVAAGYELSGTKSIGLGQLALSERYGLSVLGKLGLAAGVAGRFSILVTGEEGLPGWAHVQVRRHRARDINIAADVKVTLASHLDDMPADANEFLGAVLGVNGKSFVNVLARARDLPDAASLSAALDGLARQFVGEFIGKGFDALATKTEMTRFLAKANRVIGSYEQLGDRAVTLFDRYVDDLVPLTEFLERIAGLQAGALDSLRHRLTPQLWKVLSQLTDGDPLGFLAGRIVREGREVDSLPELQARAQAVLALIRDGAHQELRDVITVARQGFGIDVLFREAAKIDTIDELKAVATDKVGLFVSRLVGRSLDSATNLKAALAEVREVCNSMDRFTARLYGAFKEAASSSLAVALHAEYSRATERDALIDVLINLEAPGGRRLVADAARGEFDAILANTDTGLVRLRKGVLTHRTPRQSAFKVNIVGWHLDYAYEGFDRVITESEQRLVPSEHGILVLSTTTLDVGRQRTRQRESMHSNLLLRALGQSAGAVRGDDRTLSYVIDTLTSLTASYDLAFTDEDTSELELEDYLAFARDLGLDGIDLPALVPLLPRAPNGGFGKVEASYDVRFDRASIEALLGLRAWTKAADAAVRTSMRRMVLSNYLKDDMLHDVAFAYATPAVFTVYDREGHATFSNRTSRVFPVAPVIGVAAPSQVVLSTTELQVLATLYAIEQSMVDALQGLVTLLAGGKALTPVNFEKKLATFGKALESFDRFDQASNTRGVGTTTLFAMVDALVRMRSPAEPAHHAVLRLRSEAHGHIVEKLFMSKAAAIAG